MLLPANDDDYGKGKSKATALTYVTTTYFGHGNLTGQTLALYGRFQDDLVKTKDVGHGGWRIDARVLTPFVRSPNPCPLSIGRMRHEGVTF